MKMILRLLFISNFWSISAADAQAVLALNDFSFFQPASSSWKLASQVNGDPFEKTSLHFTPGTGILVNVPDADNLGKDLFSAVDFGDIDLELDYMMASGSNSGIYLQGRYEIQLLDSWGTTLPTSADNGGIYERWDNNKPDGQNGYDGHAPRQNASRAPGLWQHLKISFQAPQFSDAGNRISKAKIIRVELNGVPVQENVELSGPTRGSINNNEVARGPLRFQGDHGSVSFRNIRITAFDSSRPILKSLKFAIYKGIFETEPDYQKTKAETAGEAVSLSFNLNNIPKVFLLRFTGTMHTSADGEYRFKMNTGGGRGSIRISDHQVVSLTQTNETGKINLSAGDVPFELLYTKLTDYAKPALGLSIEGPGIRESTLSEVYSDPVDEIRVEANENTILRSFSDLSDTVRITHAVNVGSPLQIHYTYDLDKGSIVQVWRGSFLDATSMWRGRGDGASRPMGTLLRLGKPALTLEKLSTPDQIWSPDTSGSFYKPKGYVLDKNDRPAFKYFIYNTQITDQTIVLPDGHGFQRELKLQQPVSGLYARLATGSDIEMIREGLYTVNDRTYYIKIDDAANLKPLIRDMKTYKELIVQVQSKISYSLLF